jgi:hypothetical protein
VKRRRFLLGLGVLVLLGCTEPMRVRGQAGVTVAADWSLGVPVVDATFADGTQRRLLLDTGAPTALALFRRGGHSDDVSAFSALGLDFSSVPTRSVDVNVPSIAGVIGTQILFQYTLQLDPGAKQVALQPPTTTTSRAISSSSSDHALHIPLEQRGFDRLLARGELAGEQGEFVVDTGASGCAIRPSLTETIGLSASRAGVVATTDGPRDSVEGSVGPFEVARDEGALHFDSAKVSVVNDWDFLPDVPEAMGAMGGCLLQGFVSEIDAQGHELRLMPRSRGFTLRSSSSSSSPSSDAFSRAGVTSSTLLSAETSDAGQTPEAAPTSDAASQTLKPTPAASKS